MKTYSRPSPVAIVIFGAAGDLTWRKLVPALYNLHLDGWLPEELAIICMDKRQMGVEDYHRHLRDGVDQHSRRERVSDEDWNAFLSHITYTSIDFSDKEAFKELARKLAEFDRQWHYHAVRLFYMAIPPTLFETVAKNLGEADLGKVDPRNRIVVEKPFGRDLESAKALNSVLTGVFKERQIYRIDHYLGKETVQNILALRFANSLFEPIWNRRYIDHVQITVAEQVGVEHRGKYYEEAGALRDMVQNHMLQLLCLIAMEPPVTYAADEIRNKKLDVLRAIRPIESEEVSRHAVRGQYGGGWIEGQRVRAYRAEDDVSPESNIETFAALRLVVDNWRWQDVPFYLRTGKRLPVRRSEVAIQFNPVPHQSFPSAALTQPLPNRLVIRIQPDEGIGLRIQAKQPGQAMRLSPVDMRFSYKDSFSGSSPDAYETLLLDVMMEDLTQFMRSDQLEAAWSVITPILDVWESVTLGDFPNYMSGTWGPEASESLIAQDGRSWYVSMREQEPAG